MNYRHGKGDGQSPAVSGPCGTGLFPEVEEGGMAWPSPTALEREVVPVPCGHKDLIVLPRREEAGALNSQHILELAERNLRGRKPVQKQTHLSTGSRLP